MSLCVSKQYCTVSVVETTNSNATDRGSDRR